MLQPDDPGLRLAFAAGGIRNSNHVAVALVIVALVFALLPLAVRWIRDYVHRCEAGAQLEIRDADEDQLSKR